MRRENYADFSIPVMVGLPQPIIAAVRLTARRTAMWVPERHLRSVPARCEFARRSVSFIAQEGRGGHDPAVDAIGALWYLLFHVRGLERTGFSGVPRPASVTTFCSPTSEMGPPHERIGLPSRCSLQAPHSPEPQPKCGLLKPDIIAQHVNSGASGSASTV